jgi:Zn-dependent protease
MKQTNNIIATTAALFSKVGLKFIGVLPKLLKSSKFGKVGLAGASVASYTYMFNWKFATLIMVAVSIHEAGHLWAMRKQGMKTKGLYFIPFIGAAAVSDVEFPSYTSESYIALMGPIWGSILILPMLLAYEIFPNPILVAAIGWVAVVNLFNLLPILPLDGGRVMRSVAFSLSSKLGYISMFLGLALLFLISSLIGYGLFTFILVIGIIEVLGEIWRRRKEKNKKKAREELKEVLALIAEKDVTIRYHTKSDFKCPFCGKPVSANKISCPHCGSDEETGWKEKVLGITGELTPQEATKILSVDGEGIKSSSEVKPVMLKKHICYSIAVFLFLSSILFYVVWTFKHFPGADKAMALLRG